VVPDLSEQEPERLCHMEMLEMDHNKEIQARLNTFKSYELSDLDRALGVINDFLLSCGLVCDDTLSLQAMVRTTKPMQEILTQ
jgi:hypothetical protein